MAGIAKDGPVRRHTPTGKSGIVLEAESAPGPTLRPRESSGAGRAVVGYIDVSDFQIGPDAIGTRINAVNRMVYPHSHITVVSPTYR